MSNTSWGVNFNIEYHGKEYHAVKVEGTYNYFYVVVELTAENEADFVSIAKERNMYNEADFKEKYKGMEGLVPVDYNFSRPLPTGIPHLGRFRLDAWYSDENKEKYQIS